MDNDSQKKPLPEKVLRRHAEMLTDLLPDFSRLVFEEGRPADAILNSYLRTHRELGSRDRRFLSKAVFSYFRWYGWTVQKLKLDAECAALLGALLDSAELDESFTFLIEKCTLPDTLQPMDGNSLEEKRDLLNQAFGNLPDFQPLTFSDLATPEFDTVVDPASAEQSIASFQRRPPAWIRSRTETKILIDALRQENISGSAHSQLDAALSVEGGVNLTHALKGHAGQYVVQDIASQCVGLICAPKADEDWWDCCAGAGGKALHLMDLMGQSGKLLATDVRIPPLKELKKRAHRHGIKHIRTQPHNAAADEPFTKTFDGVLVDAPCSGWGTWARNPDARWRTSKRDVIQCASRQLKILNNAKWCVKPGGVLVYAVCTLTRPETEEVVSHFLDQQPDFKLQPFINPLTGEQTNGQLQIWPWDGPGDAMFIARFIRETAHNSKA
jgi:16S rRNA (cytosine967-C5)-methyltransferase